MFRPDIVELKTFYNTPAGAYVSRNITKAVTDLWYDFPEEIILGCGYPIPFIDLVEYHDKRLLIAMPPEQGVLHWPSSEKNSVVLAHDCDLPFSDNSIERIILAHIVENTEDIRGFMREIWRVLTPQGKLLIIVPNRKGVWSRIEKTPFYYGRPYSNGQMKELLRETMFSPTQSRTALFMPPTKSTFLLQFADIWERVGNRWLWPFGGVLLIEAEKQIYATSKKSYHKKTEQPMVPAW